MNLSSIQRKVGHTSQSQNNDPLNMKENVAFESALVLKHHKESDETIKTMLKKNFRLDDTQIDMIIRQLNEKEGE